jgi:ubiquinone/menaquinone biosynthesis C-methylase UbiE
MQFHLKSRPDFHEYFAKGGVVLSEHEIELAGEVNGLKILDTCCACDAAQAFSWENLGAQVIGCDLSPVAVDIARQNAAKIGSKAEFVVADAQTLTPIADGQVDLVYATYICWFEDLFLSCRSWFRVLKPGGRLLMGNSHPLTKCLEERAGSLVVRHNYFDTRPQYSTFDGTPIVDRYGGWKGTQEIVEFFHPLSEVVNAIAQAGFCIRRMIESRDANVQSSLSTMLPEKFYLLAHKGVGG